MAPESTAWTLETLHTLPDDGNKYELVRGELFVTPPPSEDHEDILARLHRLLDPFVEKHALGAVYRPRAVVRFEGSEVEPDLMVRAQRRVKLTDWDDAPAPSLVVEVLSPTTRRRDRNQKRQLYLDAGVGEYWIVDPESRTVQIVREATDDETVNNEIHWRPTAASDTMILSHAAIFGDE